MSQAVLQKTYVITPRTMAIFPAKQMEFGSIIFEVDRQVMVKETPSEIIRASCMHYGSTYEGRRRSVIEHLGFRNKIPIPIDPTRRLYVFPTHSLTNYDCAWILHHQIAFIQKHPNPTQSIVHFRNDQRVVLDISYKQLKTQVERTMICGYRFS
ncbi:competence protein ComK [Ornithinibacillus halophilus]|uniref:Competence protein ComK n=1 Tax=Ornithinibacillus halophilus TaxID=930117 RepID=A0A1M5GJ70_9BACI|nr:competence protein ComK [Ornithinibacillus halophilus]SHG03794.1 competence protein ComK [Ornithinibacillus halophilus]